MSKYLKTQDMVKITAGDDKGKTGKIISFDRKNNKIKVEGINMITSFNKETRKGITLTPGWIDASNVKYLEGEHGTALYRNGEGKRVSKKTHQEIDGK